MRPITLLMLVILSGCCCCGDPSSPSRPNRPVSRPAAPPANETEEGKAARLEREKKAAEKAEARAIATAEKAEARAIAKVKEESEGDEIDARIMAKKFVMQRLKYPDNADFHMFSVESGKTGDIFGKRHWVVTGKVDAANAFGANLTHRYRVQLFHHEGKWYPRAVTIGDEQQFFMPDLLVQAVYAPELAIAAGGGGSGDPRPEVEPEPEPKPRRPPPEPRTFDARVWHSGTFSVDATFVKYANGQVTIKRTDNGEEVTIPLTKLSADDQDYIKGLR